MTVRMCCGMLNAGEFLKRFNHFVQEISVTTKYIIIRMILMHYNINDKQYNNNNNNYDNNDDNDKNSIHTYCI